jgi:hypothetical protein
MRPAPRQVFYSQLRRFCSDNRDKPREVHVPNSFKCLAFSLMLGAAWTGQTMLPQTLAMADSEAPMRPLLPPGNAAIGRHDTDPESGSVVGDAYTNAYFGLSLPLPPGWIEGLAGPPPSDHGLYVLAAMDGTKASGATMLIVAQDLFFSAKPFSNIADVAADFHDAMAGIPDLSIDRRPADTMIGGQAFLRLDYHAGGLYRVWLATELRCHVVSFNITGTDPATMDRITNSLQAMSLQVQPEAQTGGMSDAERTTPVCIKDYVTAQTTIHRVEPVQVDSIGLTVPVRIIIGADGKVLHVHVISAAPAQRRAIEEALTQWEFRPLEWMGHPTEVETGLSFAFKSRRP